MSVFNVYLGNPTAMAYPWAQLVHAVDALIMPAIVQDPLHRYTNVKVHSTMQRPTLRSAEMLCYVVSTQFRSLAGLGNAPSPNHAGQTVQKRNGVLCEVYSRGQSVEQTARCVVHEFFHAKTGLGNAGLHRLGGVCASPPGALAGGNTDLMVEKFFAPLPQWLDGFR